VTPSSASVPDPAAAPVAPAAAPAVPATAPGPAAEPDLVRLPTVGASGRARLVHGGRAYAVFLVDGDPVVTEEACPHNGGPLSEGLIRDGAVVCPWHWYAFDLRTGACRTTGGYALRRFPVVERDGEPFVALPRDPRRSWSDILRAHARGEG